jgi:hypothetical protein
VPGIGVTARLKIDSVLLQPFRQAAPQDPTQQCDHETFRPFGIGPNGGGHDAARFVAADSERDRSALKRSLDDGVDKSIVAIAVQHKLLAEVDDTDLADLLIAAQVRRIVDREGGRGRTCRDGDSGAHGA